jgi:hypothetical protein
MSRDLQDFISAFGMGASIGNSVANRWQRQDIIDKGNGYGSNDPMGELGQFDRMYGTGAGGPGGGGLFDRLGRRLGISRSKGRRASGRSTGVMQPAVTTDGATWGVPDLTQTYARGGYVDPDSKNGPKIGRGAGKLAGKAIGQIWGPIGGAVGAKAGGDIGDMIGNFVEGDFEAGIGGMIKNARDAAPQRMLGKLLPGGKGDEDAKPAPKPNPFGDFDSDTVDAADSASDVLDGASDAVEGAGELFEDGGAVLRRRQREYGLQNVRALQDPGVAPPQDYPITSGNYAPPDPVLADETVYDRPIPDPYLDDRRRNAGDDDPWPNEAEYTTGGDPVRNVPMAVVPGFARDTYGVGDVPDQSGTSAGSKSAQPTGQTSGVTRGGNAQPQGRLGLHDQRRVAAFNPEDPADMAEADDALKQAIHGGLTYAQELFHMTPTKGGVSRPDPLSREGTQAFLSGVGAPDQRQIQQLDQIVQQHNPNVDFSQNPSLLPIKRMEIVYRNMVQTGQTDKANKLAFEIMQYSAGVAAQLGAQAVQAYKGGNLQGATQMVVNAYDQVPDGRNIKLNPDGRSATVTDSRGNVIDMLRFTPEQVFNAAVGLTNRSMYWGLLAQRASAANQKDATTQSRLALDKKRMELMDARIKKLGQGPAGRRGAAPAEISPKLKAALDAIAGDGTQSSAPVSQDGGDEAGTGQPQADNHDPDYAYQDALSGGEDEDVRDAGGEPGAGSMPPASILRTRPANPNQAVQPAPAAPAAQPQAAAPAGPVVVPDKIVGKKEPEPREPFNEPDPSARFKGKNPYREILANPEFAPEFAGKSGNKMRQGIAQKASEFDKQVTEWKKRKAAYEREGKAAIAADEKNELTLEKQAQSRLTLGPKMAEEVERSITQTVDDQIAKATEAKVTNLFNDGHVKKEDIQDLAMSIATHNPNTPPARAVAAVGNLMRVDPDNKQARVFTPLGKDRVGNVVLQVDKDQWKLPKKDYDKLQSLIDKRWTATTDSAKKQAQADATPGVLERVVRAAPGVAKNAADYIVSNPKTHSIINTGPNDKPQGLIGDMLGTATFPHRLALKAGTGVARGVKRALERGDKLDPTVTLIPGP